VPSLQAKNWGSGFDMGPIEDRKESGPKDKPLCFPNLPVGENHLVFVSY
jgi:hypothetical protein